MSRHRKRAQAEAVPTGAGGTHVRAGNEAGAGGPHVHECGKQSGAGTQQQARAGGQAQQYVYAQVFGR